MNRLQLEARLSTLNRLSTIPEVMAEIIRICDDPQAPLADLTAIIQKDIALTARVLKVVNSPYYGQTRQVATVSQAIATLGTRKVKSLALSLSVYDFTSRIGTRVAQKEFWRHALNTACTAELLAEKVAPPLAEEAFLCGLLHDIGILALDHVLGKEYAKVFAAIEECEEIITTERNLLEIDHALAGEMLAQMWNFPVRYAEAIAHHHDVINLGLCSVDDRLPQLINLADKLATFSFEGRATPRQVQFTNREVIASNLGIKTFDLKRIEHEALARFLNSSAFLDIDIGQPLELLQKCTQHLYDLYTDAECLYHELKQAQNQLKEEQLNQAALESLQAIIATFSHYLNNAVATISGRTQLLELAMQNGQIQDTAGLLAKSISVYQKSSEQIVAVISKLKAMKIFKTAIYHHNTKIIDLEGNLKKTEEELSQLSGG